MYILTNREEKSDKKKTHTVLFLLVIPGIVFSLSLVFADIKGPYYLGQNSDPEYVYLFNALNIATFEAPRHTDHPGTTLQLLGATVIRASYYFAGGESLVEDVLSRPEHYLRRMNIVLILLYSMTLFAVGLQGYRMSGRLIVALMLQTSPFLFPTIFDSLTRVHPEALLISVCNIVIISLVDHVYPDSGKESVNKALWLGLAAGIGIVTKITFAPVFLLCIFFLSTWRSRLLFLFLATLSGFILLLPAVGSLKRIGLWIVALLTHKGYYGAGESGFVDLSLAAGFLKECVQDEPIFFVVFLLLTIITIYSTISKNKTHSHTKNQFIGFFLFNWTMILIVAKHPRIHYLIPLLGLIILNIVIVINRWQVLNTIEIRKTARAGAIVVVLFLSCLQVGSFLKMAKEKRELASLQLAAAHFADLLKEKNLYIISSYRSSNLMFALYLGNGFSGNLYGNKLSEMYPNSIFYSVWRNRLYRFNRRISFASLKTDITKYVIQGSYLFSEPRYSPPPPPGMKYSTMKKIGDEGFYRIIEEEKFAPDNSDRQKDPVSHPSLEKNDKATIL
jgi:hypothetical protein